MLTLGSFSKRTSCRLTHSGLIGPLVQHIDLKYERGLYSMAESCRSYGISRTARARLVR